MSAPDEGVEEAAEPTPLPQPFEWDRGYWEAAQDGRLVVQACLTCGTVRGLPKPMCPVCGSFDHEWRAASGAATLYSWTILRRQFHRLFARLPIVICVVELDDYPTVHLVSNLLEVAEADFDRIAVGLPLSVRFERHGDIVLPQFAPRSAFVT